MNQFIDPFGFDQFQPFGGGLSGLSGFPQRVRPQGFGFPQMSGQLPPQQGRAFPPMSGQLPPLPSQSPGTTRPPQIHMNTGGGQPPQQRQGFAQMFRDEAQGFPNAGFGQQQRFRR